MITTAMTFSMRSARGWMSLFCLTVALWHGGGGGALLPAQETAREAPPQAPYVAPVPAFARWSIAPAQESGKDEAKGAFSASPVARVKMISCIRTGKVKQDIMTHIDGTATEYWHVDQYLLAPDSFDKKNILVMEPSQTNHDIADQNALVAPGFVGVRWLSAETFDKTVSFQDKECHHYTKADKSLEAWIDTKSRLPVAFRMGGVLYIYTFSSPPTAMLVLPENYQKAYDEYVKFTAHKKQLEKDLGGR